MENKSWEESVADKLREEMSHFGDFLFSLPSPADAFKKKTGDHIEESCILNTQNPCSESMTQ